tara:strand:- start:381 stop:1529 length:1149 start_codon:yes stop_codon:yes gene_type:complete
MIKKKLRSNFLFLFLGILYFPLFKYYIFLNNNKGHSFLTSDWLINYNYGFVKRGLAGTIFFNITNDPDLMLDIISISLITIYLLIFYFLNKTFNIQKQNFITVVLIFSPAAFLFPIYDSQGAFRKEIIGILTLFIVTSQIKNKNYRPYLLLGSFIYTFAIFSHSVNVFFLTTILFIIYKFYESKSIYDYSIFIIPTIFYFFMYILFSVSESELYFIRDNICNDLRDINLFNLCGHGSFDYLVWDVNANYVISQNFIINERRSEHYTYILLFLISLIPYFFDRKIKTFYFPFILIGISFIPLFVLAIDWGRWIYIMSICFLSIYLLIEKDRIQYKFSYILLLFPIFFELEHCCKPKFELDLNYFLDNLNFLIFNFENIILYRI